MSHLDPDFHPGFLEDHTVQLIKSTGRQNVRIVGVRPLPSHYHDWGALTAGTASLRNECTHLELDTGEMAQYRVIVRDPGIELELRHPRATMFWNNKNANVTVGTNWRVRNISDEESEAMRNWRWAASEFWVFEDDTPLWDVYPLASMGIAPAPQGHVEFMGYRYSFEDIGNEAGQVPLRINKFTD